MNLSRVIDAAHNGPNDGPESDERAVVHIYNSVAYFDTPPYAVESFEAHVTILAQIKRNSLLHNFPNPFNPETCLPYSLGANLDVTFRIYDVHGQLTRSLDLGVRTAGSYLTQETAAYWDGRNDAGETTSSGIYFYTLHAGTFQDDSPNAHSEIGWSKGSGKSSFSPFTSYTDYFHKQIASVKSNTLSSIRFLKASAHPTSAYL